MEGNTIPSSMQLNNEQKTVPSSDGINVQSSRKKSNGRSLSRRLKSSQSENASSNAKNISESSESDVRPGPSKSKIIEKRGTRQRNSKRISDHVQIAIKKRQKKLDASDSDSVSSGSLSLRDLGARSSSHKESEEATSSSLKAKSLSAKRSRRKDSLVVSGDRSLQPDVADSKEITSAQPVINGDEKWKKEELGDESICRQEVIEFKSWKPIEKSLFEKGLEIFGRNRSVTSLVI